MFEILLSLSILSLNFLIFKFLYRAFRFRNWYNLLTVLLLLTTLIYYMVVLPQSFNGAFMFLLYMFSFSMPILFFMKEIMNSRGANYRMSSDQLISARELQTRILSYILYAFVPMLTIFQLLLIWNEDLRLQITAQP